MIYTLITWKPGGNALITSEYVQTYFSKQKKKTNRKQLHLHSEKQRKQQQQLKANTLSDWFNADLTDSIPPLPVQYLQSIFSRALSRIITHDQKFESSFMAYVSERNFF